MDKKLEIINKALPGLQKRYQACDLCMHKCGVDRTRAEKGFCRASSEAVVYSYSPHHGEEPPLSGTRGSGTIFFSHCSMKCVYCQNYQFSQSDAGDPVSAEELAGMMLELQDSGCHNINFVSPTHYSPSIVEALKYACEKGLKIPLVYNTGGYDSLDVIRSLKGMIEIYMPDMRYSSDAMAEKYSSAPVYVENNRAIAVEMQEQVGDLLISGGIAKKGLIVRLLVLPEGISGTTDTLAFIAEKLGNKTYISLMSQYYPAYEAPDCREISRRIKRDEYNKAVEKMQKLGLENGWTQPFLGVFDPEFFGENFERSV